MEWIAVIWSGFVATVLSTAFFWMVRALGWTLFSPTVQLGCVFLRNPKSPGTDSLGFVLLLLLGSSLVPALYQVVFRAWAGPSWEAGALLGAVHGLLAVAALPLLGMISACIRAGSFPAPGRFGQQWGWFTPVGLVLGHTLYGGVAGAILAGF